MKFAVIPVVVLLSLSSVCSDPDPIERLRSVKRVKRIIGGEQIREGEWPWLANLWGKIPTSGWRFYHKNYYCGGSVINQRWILTAAHCFADPDAPERIREPKHWHIKVGEVDRTHSASDSISSWWARITGNKDKIIWNIHAQQIVLHPDYRGEIDTWKHDIALVKVKENLPVDSSDPNIGPVRLPYSSDSSWPPSGNECIMKGWGCDRNNGPLLKIAKAVDLPALHENVCNAYYGTISSTRLCAGYNQQNKGICQGDSGGPLVCEKAGRWVQAGIASFSSRNRPGDVPGVFTRVSEYRDWIDSVISNN